VKMSEQQHGAVMVVLVDGPIIEADADSLQQRVSALAADRLGRVVLDVKDVPFVDSAGLEALADLADCLAETGQTLRLCSTGETLREVLDLTELSDLIEQFEDVTDAVRSFL
jgi:anti-anti-sigma factor